VEYIESVGWAAIRERERMLGQRFLDGLPENCRLYGLNRMAGRVPTFAFNVDGYSPRAVAECLAERDIAVWDGNYYAVEVMAALGLDEGAVRVGVVHYNTADEVDRLLTELQAL
jgi:selenocysteine lyase/cysteine desulfurase